MVAVVGSELSLSAVVKSMVDSHRPWKAVGAFGGAVTGEKERRSGCGRTMDDLMLERTRVLETR